MASRDSDGLKCAHEAVQQALQPGETIVWSGRPVQGLRVYLVDCFGIPFSVVWMVGCAYLGWNTLILGGWWFLPIPLAFLAVGAYVSLHPVYWDRRRRATTHYVLTNARALIYAEEAKTKLASVDLRRVGDITTVIGGKGRGTIGFGVWWPDSPALHRDYLWRQRFRVLGPDLAPAPTFENIEDAAQVYELIQGVRASLGVAAGPSDTRPWSII